MQTANQVVQRYSRTDRDRLGQWAPVDSSWKTAASSALVAHDIYHHLPTDTGSFAQEVASLGAEWYVDRQPLSGGFTTVRSRDLEAFERNLLDTVLNALDSKERRPFCLPDVTAEALSKPEMDHFYKLARKAYDILLASSDNRARDCEAFQSRLVFNLLQGYAASKTRFPDQAAVRAGARALSDSLSDLDESEVPLGHEVTITLDGYECRIDYTDADAHFLAEVKPVEAVFMRWHRNEEGYPAEDVSLHLDAGTYFEYVDNYFERGETALLPEGESNYLRKAYVVSPATLEELTRAGSLRLPLSAFKVAQQSPRGVWVL